MKKLEPDIWKPIQDRVIPVLQKYKAAGIVLLAGMMLLASGGGCEKKEQVQQPTVQTQSSGFDLTVFEQDLNHKLSSIEGAGRVSLMLSLEETEEAVYAVNIRQSNTAGSGQSYESSLTVLSDGSYGETPVTVKNRMPAFRGAVVLCDGADHAAVRLAVTQAVSTVCGIGADKVTVLKMAADA